MNNKIKELEEEYARDVYDLMCVALRVAGVKKENLEKALQEYQLELEKMDELEDYNQEVIFNLILKTAKKFQ